MSDLILKNASLIDETGQILPESNVSIENGLITRISRSADPESSDSIPRDGGEIIDCRGLFVSPGFVNLHSHSPMAIFRGIAEDVDADTWFNRDIWPYESKMTPQDVEAGAMLAIMEMLDNGVCAFADHYFMSDRICQAVLNTGIRADIAPTLFGMTGGFEEQLDAAAGLIDQWNNRSQRLALRMGPHSPYTCSPEQLKQTAERAASLGVGLHMHVSETSEQVEKSLIKYGQTPFQILKDAGCLDLPLIVAHGLWIRDKERALIEKDTHFAVCPKTYMKLSCGQGTLWQNSGELPLCIGTDGAASSNSLSPLEQASLFALAGKFITGDPESFPLREVWQMLMKGHGALGFNSGRIAEGAAADLLIWDLNDIHTMPLYNPLASILYSAGKQNIRDSLIAGSFVKRNGMVLADTDAVRKEAQYCAKDILQRGRGETRLVF